MNKSKLRALGQKIIGLREKTGYTRYKFADKLEVSLACLSNYEHGRRRPNVDNLITLVLLAEEFDYDLTLHDFKE